MTESVWQPWHFYRHRARQRRLLPIFLRYALLQTGLPKIAPGEQRHKQEEGNGIIDGGTRHTQRKPHH